MVGDEAGRRKKTMKTQDKICLRGKPLSGALTTMTFNVVLGW